MNGVAGLWPNEDPKSVSQYDRSPDGDAK
jgi:hypothetical protein